MYFWVPFWIILSARITTGIVFVLSFHIFVTSVSRSLYLESFIFGSLYLESVLWSIWLLSLVNLHLFFYHFQQQSPIVPLCFFLPLVKLVCVCTIFLSVVSHNAFIVSSVCTWLLRHVSVSILCLLLLGILISWSLQSFCCFYTTYIWGHPHF